jgi:Cupin-like domain
MRLEPIEKIGQITDKDFKERFYKPGKPVVLTDLAKSWPAYSKWNWNYFKEVVGDKEVGIYNNTKSDAYTPVNKADDYIKFGDYIDIVSKGPAQWRIFLFNIFNHAPELAGDFTWPDNLMRWFIKRVPMLFVGGSSSITHMHFDMDLSHILHTQFVGRKKVLMFPYAEQHKLYRKPFEVLSLADFSHYDIGKKPDYDQFPALKLANGFEVILEHGDTLFMPAGYWHHMEYIDSGFAMSLRAVQGNNVAGMMKGAWNLMGMRSIDTMMKKAMPEWWYKYKEQKSFKAAGKELAIAS